MSKVKSLSDRPILLDNLKRIGNNLLALYGKRCEVAIHDFYNLKASLVFLRGTVTGRKLGAPVSTWLFQVLQQYGNNVADQYNYRMRLEGGHVVRSTTTFIRDNDGEVLGCFCVNYDVTDLLNMQELLEGLNNFPDNATPSVDTSRETTTEELIECIVMQGASLVGRRPTSMNKQDRLEVIGMLELNGIFQIKGAVEIVASMLGVTRYTIYNYIKEVLRR